MELFLYRAYSVLTSFQGRENVRVVWIPLRSGEAHLSGYDSLVRDFDRLPQEDRFHVKGYVDEFFTAGELEILKRYLAESRGLPVETDSRPTPLTCTDASGRPLVPLRLRREGEKRFIRIERTKGMDLPFDVAAVYDL